MYLKLIKSILLVIIMVAVSCDRNKTKEMLFTPGGNKIPVKELDAFIELQMANYKVPGLGIAILNGETIAYCKTFGVSSLDNSEKKITDNTIFEAASLSKPLFAYFVMKQKDKGKIKLDAPLDQYVEYPDVTHDKRYKKITARMVLSHTTGLPNWRSENDTLRFILDPGTTYSYSGEGFQYLARALASVNKVDRNGLFKVFENDVAQPLGAVRAYYHWNEDVASHKPWGHKDGKVGSNGPSDWRVQEFGSAHNLHTDVYSYAKFISAMINGTGLSKKTHQEMLRKQVDVPEDDFEKTVLGVTHWSLGFGMQNTPNGWMYSHGGNNGYFTAFTLFYPKTKFGLVLFSNSEKIMFSNFTNEVASFLETDLHMNMKLLNDY